MQLNMVGNLNKENSEKTKLKPRLYDKEGFSLRGSCVVWDSDKKENTLLVKNKKDKWCIPGGGIENYDNSYQDGAMRELKEEAGIIGMVTEYVGNFKDNQGKNKHNTFVWNVLPLQKLEEYKENYRERKWFSYQDAYNVLDEKPIYQKILFNSKEVKTKIKDLYFSNFKKELNIWF